MNTRGLELLLEPAGWALLESLPPYDPAQALALGQQLRKRGIDADLVAAAMTQSRLRAKAAAKFGPFAAQLLYTEDGLAQATRLVVAAHHAGRYRSAGCTSVADLTCGVGGDALALAGLGLEVLAVEADAVTCAIATVNLRLFPAVRVVHGDGLAQDLAGIDGVFADPARRNAGRRVFDPAAYTPPLDRLLHLAATHALGIKVGPGIAHADIPAGCEAQWVSADGDVVECGLWFGKLAAHGAGHLTALVLRGEHSHLVRDTGVGPAPVGTLGSYLYEPDGAVIRAGLVSEVAAAVGGRLLNPTIAYVTSDQKEQVPTARGYQVLDSMPFGVKRLRAYLRERGIGEVEIKKRGTAVTPEQLRPQLALRGEGRATLILTRIGQAQSVIVAQPLEDGPSRPGGEGQAPPAK